jgi:signal transduction histidine kinase
MVEELLTQAKILIADDTPVNITLLEVMLREAGAGTVIRVTDARRVLPLYLQEQPDLLILDLIMPHLDGFAVMAQLHAHIPQNRYLPILVITADPNPAVRRQALAAGAADFLTKPFDEVETVLRVQHLIEISFLQRQLQARVARDLHDGPLQDLGVLLLQLTRCEQQIQAGRLDAAVSSLHALRAQVRDTVEQVRDVITEMRPAPLARAGLLGAINELSAELQQQTGVLVQLSMQVEPPLAPALETLVFRLVQEALSNVRQHAQAAHVWITLTARGRDLQLQVRDDGHGFAPQARRRAALASGHVGLAGLYERASAQGGHLTIDSAPSLGTTLNFVLPLQPRKAR